MACWREQHAAVSLLKLPKAPTPSRTGSFDLPAVLPAGICADSQKYSRFRFRDALTTKHCLGTIRMVSDAGSLEDSGITWPRNI